METFPDEERELSLKLQMPANSNFQEPSKLSGEIGAFSIARQFSMRCELALVRPTVLAAREGVW